MVARKKTRLESLLSFNQYRKRHGAAKLHRENSTVDYNELKKRIITTDNLIYTHGASKNLDEHINNLKNEFSGQPELLYYHAKIIVLIRRDYKTLAQFEAFQQLWQNEQKFLLKHLNTRWLVSAADTFADLSQDPTERAIALSTSLLVNTIKLNETERFLQKPTPQDDEQLKTELQSKRVALFDGTSAFAVGTDDTLRNMRWRLDDIFSQNSVAGSILEEIFERLQNEETVYKRFKDRHTRQKTAWW